MSSNSNNDESSSYCPSADKAQKEKDKKEKAKNKKKPQIISDKNYSPSKEILTILPFITEFR